MSVKIMTEADCKSIGKLFRSERSRTLYKGTAGEKIVGVKAHCYGSLKKDAKKKAAEAARIALRSLDENSCKSGGHIYVVVKKGTLAGTNYCKDSRRRSASRRR
jgi:hypothetical protein